jgi:hypothetical protein
MEEIASEMDTMRDMSRAKLAKMATEKYGHLLGRELTKEDVDGYFQRPSEPKGLIVAVLRWTLGMRGCPAPEKWVAVERKED